LRTIWRANCVTCASSIARSDGDQRISGWLMLVLFFDYRIRQNPCLATL
jgi:hypothetical protein